MRTSFLRTLGFFLTLFVPSLASAQTAQTITVTNVPTVIRATSSGFFGVLYENSSSPVAGFSITPIASDGSQESTVSISVGAAYVFSRRGIVPFNPGDILGSVQATAPGPFTFVLVQYQNPSNAPQVSAVKCPVGQSVGQINPDGTTVCTNAIPLTSWNPTNGAVTFTAPGDWSAPVIFTNSNPLAQNVHAGTEFLVNTDGQFEIETFSNGLGQSILNLDTDGHIALYGSNGGGISTDSAGNTCLGATNGACNNVVFSLNGPLSNYRNVALKAGDGMPVILYGGTAPLTGNFGPYTLYTTPATGYTSSGLFRVSGYLVEMAPAGAATMQVRINYSDASGLTSQDTGTPVSFANVGAKLPFSFVIASTPSQPISVSLNSTNNPKYTFHVVVEAL